MKKNDFNYGLDWERKKRKEKENILKKISFVF